MKKLLSVMLALVIFICQLSVVSVASYDETDCISLDKFTSEFVKLTSHAFLSDEISDEAELYFTNGADLPETDIESEAENSTYQLIVKSSEKLDELDSVGYVYGYNDLHILQFDNIESFERAMEYYNSLACVEYAEADGILTEAVVDEGIVVESAADYPTSVQSNLFGYTNAKANSSTEYDVDIAVIDSGVQHDHEFLEGRVVDSGFNAVSDNGTAYDDRGHGTHVAGIIVANTNDNVTVHAYKVLNASGAGSAAQVSLGIDAAIEDGVDIINLSVQMEGHSSTLYDAVKKAYDAGITVVVSAGNAGVDLEQTPYSPGSFDEAISVMSCSNARRISSTSNYGTPCDFAAPGENIFSSYIDNTYKISSGTSMAAPFVCAAAAYLLSADNTLTPSGVYDGLLAQTQWCYGSPKGRCVYPDINSDISDISDSPLFNIRDCTFVGSLKVELFCSEENADIFYLFDDEKVFREYTEPFYINKTTKITAFSLVNGKYASDSVSVTYTLANVDTSDFVIDENGCLIGYNGEETIVKVPDYINSTEVLSVSSDAFSNNKSVNEIIFGNTLIDVFDGAFAGCDALSRFVAPALKNIGNNAFENCLQLTEIDAPSLVNIGTKSFNNCLQLTKLTSNYIEKIGDYAFYNCSSLCNISLNYLSSVGLYAFANCTSLQSFIADTLTNIDATVLSGCDGLCFISLTSITELPVSSENGRFFGGLPMLVKFLSQNITSVPDYAFCDFEALEYVCMIGVKSIGDYSFANTPMYYFNVDTITQIGKYALKNTCIEKIASSSLLSLGEGAFSDCKLLNSVSFSSVTQIPDNTFYNCASLQIATLPSCTEFGSQSFMYCSSLSTLERGDKTVIGDRAFYGCSSFLPQYLLNPVSIGSQAFYGTQTYTVERFESNYLEYVSEDAFVNVDIEILVLGNVVELYDIIEDGIVLIGSKVTSCSLPSDKGSTIYSPKGTLVSQYCIENNLNYIEYNAETAILKNPEPVMASYAEFQVLGFNLKGRWYFCNDNSDETSLICEGAIAAGHISQNFSKYYPSFEASKYKYFYCVVTSQETDGPCLNIRSSFVYNFRTIFGFSNENTYAKSFKNKKDGKKYQCIFSKESSFDKMLDSLIIEEGSLTVSPTVNDMGNEFFGTGATLNVYDNFDELFNSYYLVIFGDVNGDGSVDVLDCAKMALVIYELDTIDDVYCSFASDINEDGSVDIFDYQSVVNKAVIN